MTKITKLTSVLAITFAFAGGGTAMAQAPADEVYNPNGGVLDVVSSGTPTPTPAPTEAPATATAPETNSEAPATPVKKTVATPVAATPSTETQQATTTGNLPFTGFEAGFVALAGMMLLGAGFAVRRASREQH